MVGEPSLKMDKRKRPRTVAEDAPPPRGVSTHTYIIRLTDAERQRYEDAATLANLSLAHWIRNRLDMLSKWETHTK